MSEAEVAVIAVNGSGIGDISEEPFIAYVLIATTSVMIFLFDIICLQQVCFKLLRWRSIAAGVTG